MTHDPNEHQMISKYHFCLWYLCSKSDGENI